METHHPPRDKQARLGKPSLWIDESADDSPGTVNALRRDKSLWDGEYAEDDCSLLEENALL